MEANKSGREVRHALWRKGLLKWKLWPQQINIYEEIRKLKDNIDTVVVLCARQFGKSYLESALAIEDCIRNPGVSVLVVGPTINQTTDIVNQSLRNLAHDSPSGLIKRSKSESRWYIGDSELLIGGFDINNSSRIRGRTLYNIYLEELVDSNPDTYLDSIRSDLAPALTHSKNGRLLYFTTLPKFPDHPFIMDTIPGAQLSGAYYSYTINDNKQLTEEQYEACIKRSGGAHTVEFKREYLNQIVRDPGIICVPSYDDDKHTIKDIPKPEKAYWQITMDTGGVRDKTVALLHTYHFVADKLLYAEEKVFDANTSTVDINDSLKEWFLKYKIHQVTIDAPGQLLIDYAQMFQVNAQLPPKADWLGNLNNLEMHVASNKVLISENCPFLRQSLRSGTFNKQKTDFERTEALGHCDAIAAMMYSIRVQNRSSPYVLDLELDGTKMYDISKAIFGKKENAEVMGGRSAVRKFGYHK